ncbi:MAG: hypothetical protein LBD91_08365 [Prevotellaceae bacterium]|jgi:hypothetical protein|nr:hypothetical protein [Prevotellaceae bacterium]
MKRKNNQEEELKNTVSVDYFSTFDCTNILGKIDFAVKVRRPKNTIDFHDDYLLWAEAKLKPADIVAMLTQLVLTIGKARTFDEILPPPFLGCYDSEKIAFVPYSEIQDIFYQNDFNWNVAPSNHDTKEFRQVYSQIEKIIHNDIPWKTYLFYFEKDKNDLRRFIRDNFIVGKSKTTKINIDKNNFINIYQKWIETVKPTIQVNNWDAAKRAGIIDGDFYLADLLSDENKTLKDKLFVLLKTNHYELDRKIDESGFENFKSTAFSDNQKAYAQFWAKYERPPREDYWNFMVERRDLLVPQDVRERKGSFYTPRIWVELSQRYIADVFGDNWQDEYYVWDCCAGSGNLLVGLTNKYNIWASTLDRQDVDVMRDRIKNGANLLDEHVFQFDFLNDDFSKLPDGLQKIINNPKLRKRLIIYINPPYAEAGNRKQLSGTGENKGRTTTANATYNKYKNAIGKAANELFVQFLIRIYCEIPAAKIANFSKLKNLQAPNFSGFRKHFQAKLEKLLLIPANSFDNVSGQFPIGFFVWNTEIKEKFEQIKADVYDKDGFFIQNKNIYSYDNVKGKINNWIADISKKFDKQTRIGDIHSNGNDFQHQNDVFIDNTGTKKTFGGLHLAVSVTNLIEICICFAVRKVIPVDWLNDRDQFLYPDNRWKADVEFQNDCLAYTLFNTNVSAREGINHWIPFTESEVGARTGFESHFMASFLSGKIIRNAYADLFEQLDSENNPKINWKKGEKREFSPEAKAVFDAGRELWRYYHRQQDVNVDASLYDIREYFQGRNDKGKMNNKSNDEKYNELLAILRYRLKILAQKIEPKVYEYGFLLH